MTKSKSDMFGDDEFINFREEEDEDDFFEDIMDTIGQVIGKATAPYKWTPCTDWDLVPVGVWLVKTDNAVDYYQVATVSPGACGIRTLRVGNYASFEKGKLVAYCKFNGYNTH